MAVFHTIRNVFNYFKISIVQGNTFYLHFLHVLCSNSITHLSIHIYSQLFKIVASINPSI